MSALTIPEISCRLPVIEPEEIPTFSIEKALKQIFPRENHGKVPHTGTHSFVVNAIKTDGLEAWLNKDPKMKFQKANQDVLFLIIFGSDSPTHVRIAPLNLAIILGNLAAAKVLIASGASLDYMDSLGLTPLHHAMVSANKAMIKILRDSKAAEDDKGGYFDATPEELGSFVHPLLSDPSKQVFYYEDPDTKEIKKGDGHLFATFTKSELPLCDRTFTTRETFYYAWLTKCIHAPNESGLNEGIRKSRVMILDFMGKGAEPKLYLQQDPLTGITARSLSELNPWDVIGEFTGELHPLITDMDVYQRYLRAKNGTKPTSSNMGHIDNVSCRSIGSFMDDGFPNAMVVNFERMCGAIQRAFIFALEPIKRGDRVCIGYGAGHSVRNNPRQELRYEALKDFFLSLKGGEDKLYSDVQKIIREKSLTKEDTRKEISIEHKISYFISAMQSQILLYFNKAIESNEISHLITYSSASTYAGSEMHPETLKGAGTLELSQHVKNYSNLTVLMEVSKFLSSSLNYRFHEFLNAKRAEYFAKIAGKTMDAKEFIGLMSEFIVELKAHLIGLNPSLKEMIDAFNKEIEKKAPDSAAGAGLKV